MPDDKAKAEKNKGEDLSAKQRHERKERVLTQGTPSVVSSIADAVVIKEENIFFLSRPDGQVPLEGVHGFGLYYSDCRFLNGYEMKMAGSSANALVSTAARGYMSIFQLVNPDIRLKDGRLLKKEQIGIEWQRIVDGNEVALHDLFTFQSFEMDEVEFPVSLHFRAEFEDVFAVRGLLPEKLGKLHDPEWDGNVLHFLYDGADGKWRSVSVYCTEELKEKDKNGGTFNLKLKPDEKKEVLVSLYLCETPNEGDAKRNMRHPADLKHIQGYLHRSSQEWLGQQTSLESDSLLVNSIVERSFKDLRVLRSSLHGEKYFAAGLPWFGTLFGRDALVTSLQTLAYQPEIAEETLRILARYQADKVDDWRDAQPGKILHEMRVGEMASTNEIPHSPYYGTIDATILFLILIGEHARWTGELTLFNDLRSNVERAIEWMAKYGDFNHDGYIEYASTSEKGLINQGWKDSGDAIVDADGSLGDPPIALVEVQGYMYMAKLAIADLYRRVGDGERADQLQKEADELRERFNKDFWMEDKRFYALALEKDHKQAAVVSSNPGQALWTGIVDQEKAAPVVERLLAEDMYNGWGVRTLSDYEKRYNPISYHLGTVWPHDNSIIAAGLRRYGFNKEAARVCEGIIEAAMNFSNYRLPELFAGYDREDYGVPVHYPVACHPQAWAAGSVPFMLSTLLGLEPEAFDKRLRIVRPTLPQHMTWLEMRGLRVGKAQADLRFEKSDDGCVEVQVLKVDGELEVKVEGQD